MRHGPLFLLAVAGILGSPFQSLAASVAPVHAAEVTRPRFVSAKLSSTGTREPNRQFTYTGIIKKRVAACNVHAGDCLGVELQLPLSDVTARGPKWVSALPGGSVPATPIAEFKSGVAIASMNGNGGVTTVVDDVWVDIVRAVDQPEKLYLHVSVTVQALTGTNEVEVVIPYQATVLGRLMGGVMPGP